MDYELERTAMESPKRVVDLEAEVDRLMGENSKLSQQLVVVRDEQETVKETQVKAKAKYVKLKEEYKCAESKWKEEKEGLTDKCWEAELEKKKLEIDLQVAAKRLEDGGGNGDVALRLKEAEGEVGRLKSLLEEKEATVAALLRKNGDLQRKEGGADSELIRKIEALEKVKAEMDAEMYKLKRGVEMDCEAKRAREAEHRRVVEKVSELVRKSEGLEEEMAGRNGEIRKLECRLEMDCVVYKAREAENRRGLEMRVLELVRDIEVLEKDKGDMDAEICELKSSLEMDSEAKRAGEAENLKLEEKISELVEKIDVLEMGKGERDAEILKLKMDNSMEAERIVEVNNALEAEKKRTGDASKTISELTENVAVLEAVKEAGESEKRAMEEKVSELDAENRRGEEKVSELVRKIEGLEEEKAGRNAEIRKLESRLEMDCVVNRAREAKNRRILEMRVLELVRDIEVLEKDKEDMDAEICELKSSLEMDSRAREAGNQKAEEGVSKFIQKIELLEKEGEERDAEIGMLRNRLEMDWEAKRVREADNRRVDEEKILELVEKIQGLEKEKGESRTLEAEKNEKMSELEKRVMKLERDKAEMEAEVDRANRDKNDECNRTVEVKKSLEVQMRRAEEAEKRDSGNLKVIGVLKREKEASEAIAMKAHRDKSKEIVALVEERNKKISDLVKRTEVLEREKMELEAEVHKAKIDKSHEYDRVVVLNKIVEVIKALEAQKRRAEEAIALNAKKEKRKEIERILNEKKTMEDEGTKRIEVVEREKKEMETKFCQVVEEKSEEILRILNEKMDLEAEKRAIKDDYEKKNLELADRISILETEKRVLEAEIMEKDGVIKVLTLENGYPVNMEKELDMEINGSASKSEEDVGTLSTPSQNEGQNSADTAHSSEHNGSIDHNVNTCKRKRPISKCNELSKKYLKPASEHVSTSLRSPGLVDEKPVIVPCEKNTEMYSTRRAEGSNGGEVRAAYEWEVDQDLLGAFDVDPELCLKAVCTLYRQHMRLPDSTNCVLSPGSRVFKPEYSLQAITLGEYLTTEDPEGRRMQKMVGKLNMLDPLAVGVCRSIAKQHYKQVFKIYKKKEDPLFIS